MIAPASRKTQDLGSSFSRGLQIDYLTRNTSGHAGQVSSNKDCEFFPRQAAAKSQGRAVSHSSVLVDPSEIIAVRRGKKTPSSFNQRRHYNRRPYVQLTELHIGVLRYHHSDRPTRTGEYLSAWHANPGLQSLQVSSGIEHCSALVTMEFVIIADH